MLHHRPDLKRHRRLGGQPSSDACVEDRIRELKNSGLSKLPFSDFDANQAWLELALTAHTLTAWTQALLLDGEHAIAEPKRLRYRLWHVARKLTRHARRSTLHLPPGLAVGRGDDARVQTPRRAPRRRLTRAPPPAHSPTATTAYPARSPLRQTTWRGPHERSEAPKLLRASELTIRFTRRSRRSRDPNRSHDHPTTPTDESRLAVGVPEVQRDLFERSLLIIAERCEDVALDALAQGGRLGEQSHPRRREL